MIEINDTSFSTIENDEKILLKFSADWCGPCKMISPMVEKVCDDVKIVVASIDVEESPNLTEKFAIYSVPCLVLFGSGKEIARVVGSQSESQFRG